MGRANDTRWNALSRALLASCIAMLPIAAAATIGAREAAAAVLPGSIFGPGFIGVPVFPTKLEPQVAAHLRKRSAGSGTELRNWHTGYSVNVSLGNPGQASTVIVDTGSFELWVNPDCSRASRAGGSSDTGLITVDSPLTDPRYCKQFGSYDPSLSSTSRTASLPGKTFGYADYTTVTVNYRSDVLTIAGLTIENQVFAVANASNATAIGIMGMGPSPYGFNASFTYPLILANLATAGMINSPAFSLALRDFDSTTGSLIFGGVDKGKYSGPLHKIPFETVTINIDGREYPHISYWAAVTGMSIKSNSTSRSYNLGSTGKFTAVVDSGTSVILLPNGLAAQICRDVGGSMPISGSDLCVVDCAIRRQLMGGLTFSFGGKEIVVSYQNLISFNDFGTQQYCSLDVYDSMVATDPPTYILGAPFLRSAYAVFDWSNANLHLGQAADCGTNIVAIGNGTDAVPSVAGACTVSSAPPIAARNQALALLGLALSLALLL